ncbi:MAG TPA: hypothetical protein VIE37_09005, partial [Methylomirabilota bacterium]
MMQGGLGQQRQRVSLLLGQRRHLRGNVHRAGVCVLRPLIQHLARCRQRLPEQRPDFRLQPAPDDHHAVCVLIHVQGPALVPAGGLLGLGLAVHPPPAPHDPLDVLGGAGPADRQQPRLGLRRGHPGQGPDLGVGQLPAGQG